MSEITFDPSYTQALSARRDILIERAQAAAKSSGRSIDDITLIAVSKTVDEHAAACAIAAGYRVLGENRPQELVRKKTAFSTDERFSNVPFHMIGNLQTNKINQVLGNAQLIHSMSSLHLARAISQRALRGGTRANVLLEVNVSGEESKGGFTPESIKLEIDQVLSFPGICVQGLMTMAPQGNPDGARATFSGLRELRDELQAQIGEAADLRELSMGMSEDFETAIEEGATIVRLGRIVFDTDFAL